MKIIIIVLLHLFISNIHAVDRVKKINKYLSEITSSKGIEKLYPLYNGYAYIYCKDTNSLIREAWLDGNELKIKYLPEDTEHRDVFIAYGGYACLRAERSLHLHLYKVDGTRIFDDIDKFTPFYQHLSIYRQNETLLYKKGKLTSIRRPKGCSLTYLLSGEVLHNKFLNADGSCVYDKKLKIVTKETDYIETEKMNFKNTKNFHKIYSNKNNYSFITWFNWSEGQALFTINNEKHTKKEDIILPYLDNHVEISIYEKKGLIEQRLVDNWWGERYLQKDVVYRKENGDSIMPENYRFTGYFKNYILCENDTGTSAITLSGEETSQIKLGKCLLNKIGRKWVLNSFSSIDSIEYVTGLNSDKYIGITINGKNGIIDKDGNMIVEPDKYEIFIDKLYFVCRTANSTYWIYDKKGNIIGKDLLDFYFDHLDLEDETSAFRYKTDKYHYMFFKIEDGKYRYFLRKKKKSKVFYADEINTEDLSNRYLPIKKDGIWQYLEIK